MSKKKIFFIVLAVLIVAYAGVYFLEPKYAFIPSEDQVLNESMTFVSTVAGENQLHSYDLWGTTIQPNEAEEMKKTADGQAVLSPDYGAIRVDDEFIDLGREMFYKETFNNEEFLTDIMGILDGPITVTNISKAILELRGGHTNNLQVELAEDITLGGKTYKKGEKVDTGLDVPKGSLTPLGMPITFADGRIKAGVSCAACHATVDRNTGKVIEGAPNRDFNAGLVMAMAPNSAAYFTNTDVDSLKEYIRDSKRTVMNSKGEEEPLPDAKALEEAVDETLVKWPSGNFDSTMDLESNPMQIPDSFTLGDHPYGWTGFASVGPFKGLSALNNNVHAQNSDTLAQFEQSNELFDIDKEVYIATILQNAPRKKYRYNPDDGEKPSKFLATVDESPEVPGVNEMVKPPQFPNVSMISPNGTVVSSRGFNVGEQINAMSAYQNTLVPPRYEEESITEETKARGRKVFNEAGCGTCHAGETLTNHRVIPVEEIQTEGSRAKAFKDTQEIFDNSYYYAPNTPVPVPDDANILKVPTEHLDDEQINLAYAHDGSDGGYKVKGLIGLAYTAPYLHDGGVAVGPNIKTDVGIPGTLNKGIEPDPRNSLRAMIDQSLRERVIAANKASSDLQDVHIKGVGHTYWVDETTGFSEEDQEALIDYLLSLTASEER
ncbi:electron transport protein [Desertibacillus haloalkaliphilus]|uniref:electron transport protein n=1 Tax=Desertibacillus haloalkaliphilus TaxID=1328930 RepID=UPI001C265B62|nr:electron transport protein [Desertibacillus haloalkaliphilus]MBU8906930.1 electron transport protein [Desertibacillus haloalkaliphilus]